MPPYAGIFVQLTFLNTLVEILLNSNETLNRASGKIRKFQIIISVAQLLILIVSYIVLEITGNSILTVAVTNVIYLLIFIPRITVNKPYIGITFGYFFQTYVKRSYDCNLYLNSCMLCIPIRYGTRLDSFVRDKYRIHPNNSDYFMVFRLNER